MHLHCELQYVKVSSKAHVTLSIQQTKLPAKAALSTPCLALGGTFPALAALGGWGGTAALCMP